MKKIKIGVVGLGYVGLPLARLFSTKYKTVGFDLNSKRVKELMSGYDATLEVEDDLLQDAINNHGFVCTTNPEELKDCNFYVVAVPTPVDEYHKPDLNPLKGASEIVGKVISEGDIVVYESTVYPGVTEDYCVPIVEKVSHLKYNVEFFAGYSPERINPGDRQHTVVNTKKITSGSTLEIAKKIDEIYSSVVEGGTYPASSIRVAEAAKVIENSQRDINIAFVNELSKIFAKLDIDTHEVLDAAGSKWNFLKYNPGLVGGHCIGVDPYYLAQCAERNGYHPEIILAGRRMNDSMGSYVVSETIQLMLKKGIRVLGANVLIMGVTFKENCPDVRNTRVIDIYRALEAYNVNITIFDPWADPKTVLQEHNISVMKKLKDDCKFDAAIVAVAHNEFRTMSDDELLGILNDSHVIYDVKGIINRKLIDGRL